MSKDILSGLMTFTDYKGYAFLASILRGWLSCAMSRDIHGGTRPRHHHLASVVSQADLIVILSCTSYSTTFDFDNVMDSEPFV